MNQILTIAGGVIAVYIILALIVSQVTEWINNAFNLRGRLLLWGIEEMLSARNPSAASVGPRLVQAIYAHPLIGNLGMKALPSYVGPRTFTVSMIAALRSLDAQPGQTAPAAPDLSADGDALLKDLRARVTAVLPENDPLRKSLGLIIEQTANRYDAVLLAFDAWFESQMDRVTGTFKRYAFYFQLGVALVFVDACHADTFALVSALSKSAAAQSAVAAAQAAQNASVPDAVKSLLQDGLIPQAAATLGIWIPHTTSEYAGLALTWFAVLLGAPFWFDVLKQIVPVRLSGPKPDAQAARAGDRQAVSARLGEQTAGS